MANTPHQPNIQSFIDRWQASGAAERANYQLFLSELCEIIEVENPKPASDNPHENAYVFEKAVPSAHGTTNFIDLYKRGCFVLEAKQGSDKQGNDTPVFSEAALRRRKQRKTGTAIRGTKAWDTAMEKARQQAQTYARSLPMDEIADGRPPFIIVVDVGNTIALFSEFTRTGGNYIPFPDPSTYRLKLDDLHDPNVRKLLHQVWEDPMSLDPSRRSAKVTREIAARLAELAKSLEGSTDAETVAHFLMRCLFTMFAEDVGLLPRHSFTQLLDEISHDPDGFKPMLEHLWGTMDEGGFSVILRRQIPKFNGGLFADRTALPLTLEQIELLAEASKADWRDVEPAIFGTLLERALNPVERHKLGAHYTPRAYVERLVKPTIIEPLRAEWESVQAAALLQVDLGKPKKAIAEVEAFHRRLAAIRILDPACGSGNFLYVTLEHMKRLEGEVLNTLQELGEGQMRLEMSGITVSPEQFLGIEVNPRAAAITELVLWIGYLQWHYRTSGNKTPAEPIIRDFHNIECRDAVLAWDAVEPLLDKDGQPVTSWDGRTTKPHPVTGEPVPNEEARVAAMKYINPRPADWPKADFIVGNPPYLGARTIRLALGDEYLSALRSIYSHIPDHADYVMYWWCQAAKLVQAGESERFGLITTKSISQEFSRKAIVQFLSANNPISFCFAIPNHPWVDSADGADVRVALTVCKSGRHEGELKSVINETPYMNGEAKVSFQSRIGFILPNLTIGVNTLAAKKLKSNIDLSCVGYQLSGKGFILNNRDFKLFESNGENLKVIRALLSGRDITQNPRQLYAIDLFGLNIDDIKNSNPEVYQWIYDRVKPERDHNNRRSLRENWWVFGEARSTFRPALIDLDKIIVTSLTARHRTFSFVDADTICDSTTVMFALEDAWFHGVLSSKIHTTWAVNAGGRLGVGNDPRYLKGICFETFPFPDATEAQKIHIRNLAEQLDSHRKKQQSLHSSLTLTNMYNVLEKERLGEPLSSREKTIHEQGLISILKQIHNDLDEAVFAAYRWPTNLTDDEILNRLLDLNAERTAEEANGLVRWLRPEYQAPEEAKAKQAELIKVDAIQAPQPTIAENVSWPKPLKDRATAVRSVMAAFDTPVGVSEVAAGFNGRKTKKRLSEIEDILDMLVALGQVREEGGKFAAG